MTARQPVVADPRKTTGSDGHSSASQQWFYALLIAGIFFLLVHDPRPDRYFMVQVSDPIAAIYPLKQPILALLILLGILPRLRAGIPESGLPMMLAIALALLNALIVIGYMGTGALGSVVLKPLLSLSVVAFCSIFALHDRGIGLPWRCVAGGYLFVAALLVTGLIQWRLNPAALTKSETFELFAGRLYGTASNSNVLALALAPVAAAAAHAACRAKSRLHSTLHLTALFLLLAALFWTGSRSGLGIALLTVFIVMNRNSWRAAALIFMASSVALFVIQYGATSQRDWMIDSRSAGWSEMLEYIAQEPISGHGAKTAMTTQNSYLAAWAIYGIGAFALCVASACMLVFTAFQLISTKAARRTARGRGALAAVLGGLLVTMTEDIWIGTASPTLICILVGVFMGINEVRSAKRQHPGFTH